MQEIEGNDRQDLINGIAAICIEQKYNIYLYLEQLIIFWLNEAPPQLFQLFYENEGTELEYANLELVGQIDLSGEITIGHYLELYDGREIPTCYAPGGWEYPTIGDDLQDMIDDAVQQIAIEYIKQNVLKNQLENSQEILQKQFYIYIDRYEETVAAEAIYMEIKNSLKKIAKDIFSSFFDMEKNTKLRDIVKNTKGRLEQPKALFLNF